MGIRPRELALLLHSIEGDDLKSKCEFMMRTCSSELGSYVHSRKMWDFILEVAVKENLKVEQMVKKVSVFTDFGGYGDEQALYRRTSSRGDAVEFSENLLKSFLDNGGEIGRRCLMEAAIADKEYQALSVVD
ncbi:PREDICTED: LOW QUALITY PROTEIN [Prunus dulcis]|uniref:PREDICTED: LOW QUALITY PROTEIN n=1 Tax=Prunus dulcis TaxID=3755 RepID=A0A5E4FNL3_PRUDU|nr:PREDICTED: LOW QUALITY PROTEIN [Prunus dulcis]